MTPIHKKVENREFIDEAHEYYKREYLLSHCAKKTTRKKSLKYYAFLSRWFDGERYEFLAHELGVDPKTMINMLKVTQNRVDLYVKLKEMGKL